MQVLTTARLPHPQAAAKIMAMRSAGIANLARAALAAEQAK
jgi:hypothetical protein